MSEGSLAQDDPSNALLAAAVVAVASESHRDEPVAENRSRPRAARTPFSSRLKDAWWASTLGAAVFLAAIAIAIALTASTSSANEAAIWLVTASVAVATGVFAGFARPLVSYPSLVRRVVAIVLIGGTLSMLLLGAALLTAKQAHIPKFNTSGLVMLPAALLGCAFARARGFLVLYPETISDADKRRRAIRRRRGALLFLGATFVGSLLLADAEARCWVGFGESCTEAAGQHSAQGDARGALSFAERGCAHGSHSACDEAAWRIRADPTLAEPTELARLVRRSCTLGGSGCEHLRDIELDAACTRYDSLACQELGGRVHASDFSEAGIARAKALYEKACRLGLEESCAKR